MKPLATLTILIAALLSSTIATAAKRTLILEGNQRPREYAWIKQAAANVPLPTGTYWLGRGDPEYIPSTREIYLPQPGWGGWRYADEHYLLLHELGHVFDYEYLSPAERDDFRRQIESSCSWWSTRCKPPRNRRQSVPPGERFAELYAACALHLTRLDADTAGYPSYGWDPPAGKDDLSLCALFWQYRAGT